MWTQPLQFSKYKIFVIMKTMNQISPHIKQIFLNLGLLLISLLILSVWVFGPVQAQKKDENERLEKLFSKSAFKQCELIHNRELDPLLQTARCFVSDEIEVWVVIDEAGTIVDRKNMNRDDRTHLFDTLKKLYQSDDVEFTYYINQFVISIKTQNTERILSLDSYETLLKVEW